MRRRRSGLLLAVVIAAGLGAAALGAGAGGADDDRAPDPAPTATVSAPPPPATPAPTGPPAIRRWTYGRGARGVAVVRPDVDGRLPAVVFLHGWGYQRASDYRPWIRHLAREGNAVIVPRYQTSAGSDPAGVREAVLTGVRRALRRLDLEPESLVAVGHSAGAALAADYAAVARDVGLPQPRAVFAVFPGRAILGTAGIPQADLSRIAPRTRLVVLAGARDTVVGSEPARALVAAATAIPDRLRTLLVVRDPGAAEHLAPLRRDVPARRAFWQRLDRVIASVRGS